MEEYVDDHHRHHLQEIFLENIEFKLMTFSCALQVSVGVVLAHSARLAAQLVAQHGSR